MIRSTSTTTLIISFAFILLSLCNRLYGQSAESLEFEPNGTIYGDLFINFNHDLENDFSSFRLNRLHLGYKYEFTKNWYFNGLLESALEAYNPIPVGGDYNDITNLFEFCLGFQFNRLEGKVGLIGTELNQQQERLWKHRYVDKVYADKYALAPTNDFGLLTIYRISPKIKLDVAITNGEGHKNLQADSTLRIAGGATVKLNKYMLARVYSDMVNYHGTIQSNLIGILGFTNKLFSIGLEWNLQSNSAWQQDYRRNGYSAYLSADLNEKVQLFSRFDYVSSNQPAELSTPWNLDNDGSLIISGLQYKIIEQVLVAVNYRNWSPYNATTNKASLVFLDLALNF